MLLIYAGNKEMAMDFIEMYFRDSTQNEYKPNLKPYAVGEARNEIDQLEDGFTYGIKGIAVIVGPIEEQPNDTLRSSI
ncbi:hypothetical protein, partial [Paenibacillus koleovorans]|uniref:hypothetical protein n=1 Tax=Paenibacillus koleovorans TaxID=121608 RepID=UPI001C3FA670